MENKCPRHSLPGSKCSSYKPNAGDAAGAQAVAAFRRDPSGNTHARPLVSRPGTGAWTVYQKVSG